MYIALFTVIPHNLMCPVCLNLITVLIIIVRNKRHI